MLGYNRLGINGRLGNQMFQYAALRGIAAKHNYDWVIPPLDHTTIPMAEYVLFDGFKMSSVKESNFGFIPQDRPTYDEPSHDFDINLFNNCPDNINLDGFRQSEKYFKHIEDEIREDFTFKDDIYEPCKEFISQYGDDIIFLHVRRSDSTGRTEYFPIADIGWFEEMLEYFPKDVPVLILTDKLDWVKSQKLFDQDRFLLSEQREYSKNLVWNGRGKMEYTLSPWIDLCLMSLCNGGIVPNTTFGWWGAWLQKSKNKKIVYQHPYFGPIFTRQNEAYIHVRDMHPEDWIRGHLKEEHIDTVYTPSDNEVG